MVVAHMMPLSPSQDAYFGRCPHSKVVALTGTPLRLPTVTIKRHQLRQLKIYDMAFRILLDSHAITPE